MTHFSCRFCFLIAVIFGGCLLTACNDSKTSGAKSPDVSALKVEAKPVVSQEGDPLRPVSELKKDQATTGASVAPHSVYVAPSTTTSTSFLISPKQNASDLTPRRFCKMEETAPVVEDKSRPQGAGNVLSGLDVLEKKNFDLLQGKKIGLLVNHSAIDRDGNHLIDLLLKQKNVKMMRLFSPEHGLFGDLDTQIADFTETRTRLMVHSLYGKRPAGVKPSHPAPEQLDGLDAVVVDMQDIGARFYTYPAFMAYMMEECAPKGVEVIVLDRPNPIGGLYVDGPFQDEDNIGRPTAYLKMPVAHGMTMGEMAELFNKENKINCKLTVVKMENWKRNMFWDETGLRWVNPSPNIQDLDAAIAYPGIGMTERVVSMGRGTTEPFHIIGTPYVEDVTPLIEDVHKNMKGIRLEPCEFTPTGVLARYHVGEKKLCKGVRLQITDRKEFRSVELGLRIMAYMQKYYGGKTKKNAAGQSLPLYDVMMIRASCSAVTCAQTRELLTDKRSFDSILETVNKQTEEFKKIRANYLLY